MIIIFYIFLRLLKPDRSKEDLSDLKNCLPVI